MPVTVIILDSLGVGALPDADRYGDAGSNTIAGVARAVGGLNLPHLEQLGLGNLTPIQGVRPVANHATGAYGIMQMASPGKDTITGHWELMGQCLAQPLATFPRGFPAELVQAIESRIGRPILGNVAASGTEIIERLGADHIRTGHPIVYTSADSVLQVAAHEQAVSVEELYEMCGSIRKLLDDRWPVARVIARPFAGAPGRFQRTPRRRDFSLPPPGPTVLDLAVSAGYQVTGIGKIYDIFAGCGISRSIKTAGNADALDALQTIMPDHPPGVIIANLIDFDMLYGHRNDAQGYARALTEFDRWLPGLAKCGCGPIMLCADHGCDPTHPGTDHTREYVPVLVTRANWTGPGVDLGVRRSLADLGATVCELLSLAEPSCGTSFANDLLGKCT